MTEVNHHHSFDFETEIVVLVSLAYFEIVALPPQNQRALESRSELLFSRQE